jgi:hypothetical protein
LTGCVVALAVSVAFVYGQTDVAIDSIRFDLQKIGESIYQAHSRSGTWPTRIALLNGTAYLKMPYRKGVLEQDVFSIVWRTDLDPNPALNRDRILAYSNGGLLARLGFVWACRGDLRIERVGKQELAALRARTAAK